MSGTFHRLATTARGPGHLEGPLQAQQCLTPGRLPQPRLARRQRHQLHAGQVQRGDLQRRQDAVILPQLVRPVGPGQGQAGEQPGMEADDAPATERVDRPPYQSRRAPRFDGLGGQGGA